jgi:hypothetical protein
MLQQHPYQLALHKYMFELLEERYHMHSNIISRISHYLVTEQDLREFSLMLGDMYEKAYTKALNDYHIQLEAAGIKVAVSYGTKSDK